MKFEVGKRLLFRSHGAVRAGFCEEISPSGNFARVGDDWFDLANTPVIEELPGKAVKTIKAATTPAALKGGNGKDKPLTTEGRKKEEAGG